MYQPTDSEIVDLRSMYRSAKAFSSAAQILEDGLKSARANPNADITAPFYPIVVISAFSMELHLKWLLVRTGKKQLMSRNQLREEYKIHKLLRLFEALDQSDQAQIEKLFEILEQLSVC
jgi:hypothetical protein